MNPGAIMKLMGMKKQFEKDHPKFVAFIGSLAQMGISEGSIIEITVTNPDGKTITSNMKVNASDLKMIEELKNFKS